MKLAYAEVIGDPIAQSVKEERKEQFMAAQSAILNKKLQKMVGQTLTVNVDGFAAEDDLPLLTGRYYGQAPEIDGCVILNDCDAQPGDFVKVRVESVFEENLVARPV